MIIFFSSLVAKGMDVNSDVGKYIVRTILEIEYSDLSKWSDLVHCIFLRNAFIFINTEEISIYTGIKKDTKSLFQHRFVDAATHWYISEQDTLRGYHCDTASTLKGYVNPKNGKKNKFCNIKIYLLTNNRCLLLMRRPTKMPIALYLGILNSDRFCDETMYLIPRFSNIWEMQANHFFIVLNQLKTFERVHRNLMVSLKQCTTTATNNNNRKSFLSFIIDPEGMRCAFDAPATVLFRVSQFENNITIPLSLFKSICVINTVDCFVKLGLDQTFFYVNQYVNKSQVIVKHCIPTGEYKPPSAVYDEDWSGMKYPSIKDPTILFSECL